MILTVNIGNTHITIAGYEHDTLQFSGRLHSSPAATVDEYAMNLLNLLSLYQVAPERIEGGILGSVVPALTGRVLGALRMFCSARFLTVGPGLKSGIKLRLDNPAQLGAELLCGAVAGLSSRTGRGARTAGGHLGRYCHLHYGSQRQTGAGGRCHPARAAALPFRTGAKNCPAAPDRPLRSSFLLDLGQEHLCLLTERFCAGHRRAAGRAGRALSGRAWPGYPLLCHRQPAPHHPGGLPHADRIPGVFDHGRPIPHLAEKSERVISKSKGVLHHEVQTCISALLSDRAHKPFWLYQSHPACEGFSAHKGRTVG